MVLLTYSVQCVSSVVLLVQSGLCTRSHESTAMPESGGESSHVYLVVGGRPFGELPQQVMVEDCGLQHSSCDLSELKVPGTGVIT